MVVVRNEVTGRATVRVRVVVKNRATARGGCQGEDEGVIAFIAPVLSWIFPEKESFVGAVNLVGGRTRSAGSMILPSFLSGMSDHRYAYTWRGRR